MNLRIIRAACLNALWASLAYGAVTNLLTFVRPVLANPVDPNMPVALYSHLLILGAVLPAAIVLAWPLAMLPLAPGSPASRVRDAVVNAAGVSALALVAAAVGVTLGQRLLPAIALFALAVGLLISGRATGDGRAAGGQVWAAWVVSLLLAFVPYVAEPRGTRGVTGWVAAGVAVVAAMTLAGVGVAMARTAQRRALRALLAVALVAAVAAGICGGDLLRGTLFQRAEGAAPPPRRAAGRMPASSAPNVVVIVLDAVRADHTTLGGYRRDTTPRLGGLARSSATRYASAISPGDFTVPSHASLLTGLLPSRHGAVMVGNAQVAAIDERVPTLAERMQAAGWRTAAVVANTYYLDPRFGFARGFDAYDLARHADPWWGGPYKPYFIHHALQALAVRVLPLSVQRVCVGAATVTDRAIGIVRQKGADRRPFFLFLNYMDAHVPYIAPRNYRAAFDPPSPPFSWTTGYEELRFAVLAGNRAVTPVEREFLEASYDAGIAYMDVELGRLFGALREQGEFDNTLVVVTSDHGQMFGESGMLAHGGGLFTECVHVPLLVKRPGQREAATVRTVVSLVDVMPTVEAVAGLDESRSLDGRPLPTRDGEGGGVAIAESFENSGMAALNARFSGNERAAFSGPEVYRIRRDGTIVVERWQPAGEADAVGHVASWDASDAKLRQLAIDAGAHPRTPVVAPAARERLRALGYLGR